MYYWISGARGDRKLRKKLESVISLGAGRKVPIVVGVASRDHGANDTAALD